MKSVILDYTKVLDVTELIDSYLKFPESSRMISYAFIHSEFSDGECISDVPKEMALFVYEYYQKNGCKPQWVDETNLAKLFFKTFDYLDQVEFLLDFSKRSKVFRQISPYFYRVSDGKGSIDDVLMYNFDDVLRGMLEQYDIEREENDE